MFKVFKKYPNLKFGLSQKVDGPMELSESINFPARKTFFAKNNFQLNQTVRTKLAHSANVAKVGFKDVGTEVLNIDALVTNESGVVLTVTVADCYPIYFYDPVKKVIALAHSGWRGSVSNLIANTVKIIGDSPANVLVGVGPGIGPCHFEIHKSIIEKFKEFPDAILNREGKIFIDLPKIIQAQLINAGIQPENIGLVNECTYCSEKNYFSFRRDKPEVVQAMIAYITM